MAAIIGTIGAIVGIVIPVIELGRFIAASIKDQLNYLCCFNRNKKSLTDEAERLKTEMDSLQMRVDAANRNANDILPVVEAWLDDSKGTIGIEVEIKDTPSDCLAIKSRYSLSKKAKKTADAMKDLRERCPLTEICVPAPPASRAPIPQGPSDEFESRKQIEEKIMEDLKSRNVHIMGIWGMGGVGKTTLAERIMDRVREEELFDEAVMAVVSQRVDQRKIQDEIAGWLGLTLTEESISVRAKKLHDRLLRANRFLLILDDVWEKLDLKKLGITCKSDLCEGCAIVLTSRDTDVLRKMDAKPYAMKILPEKEAWSFFIKKVGTWLDDSDLISIAKKVANECKGLPLALKIVGAILENEKRKNFWEDYLDQLKHANPITMPEVPNEVYRPLRLSYDTLENEHVKPLFLLCCIFPEDWEINLDELTMCGIGIGLRMFEGMSVEGARNRVRTSLEMLKGRSLLLDGRDENHVKMHDVVRDVATFIASEKGHVVRNLSNCAWVSVTGEEINELPNDLRFPNLRLLYMGKYPNEISMSSSFFQGKEELNVLHFHWISCRSLPETTQLLKNLRTLHLIWGESLETISIVGQLLSLEILICRYCSKIKELPVEIGRLKRLKLLEVSECEKLKRIAPEVISKLVQLEELIIVGSFVGWERKTNGKQRVNAGLCELEHLKNLTRLDIEIEDLSLVTEEIRFSTKIVNYHIRFKRPHVIIRMRGIGRVFQTRFMSKSGMDLILGKDITLARWIHVFLRSTHSLSATGDGSNNLDLIQAQKLKRLVYKDCSTVNKLVNITSVDWSFGVFPFLESLELRELPNLEEICKLPKASNSFGNLKELEVYRCDKLRKLFPLSLAKEGLLLLEKLEIQECEMMEEVFANEENEKDGDQCHMITFPKLKELKLLNLHNLTTFCNQKVSFGSLMEITIRGLDKCNKLFSSAIIKDGLLQLEKLEIDNCKMMEEVFSNEENGMDGEQCHTITFPKLKSLYLKDLPRLTSFCKGSENIEFPLLKNFVINNCEKLTSLISSTCDSLNLEGHDHDSFHLFCNQKVSFGCLKEFFLESYVLSNMWCHQIPVGFFSQLVILRICNSDVIRSLFSSLIAANLVNLKELEISSCNEMVKVIEDDEEMLAADQNPNLQFPCLVYLSLRNLPQLQSFCNWRCDMMLPSLEIVVNNMCPLLELESVIFGNVQKINIQDCDGISSLFSSSMAKNLVNLKEFDIRECNEMVKVIEDIDEEMLAADQKPHCILFPSLKKLHFQYLPKLQWRCDLMLPSLEDVFFNNCSLLEFFTIKSVIFGNLKEIRICGCDCKFLFSSSIARNLVNLNVLQISSCNEMVKVIDDIDVEMLAADQNPPCILFPCLECLLLRNLPKLQSFCNWRCDLQLPSLERVEFHDCPLLEFFTMGSVSTPNLIFLAIDDMDKDVGDLNNAIQLHSETNQH